VTQTVADSTGEVQSTGSQTVDTAADRASIAAYYRQTQWQYYGLWSGRGTLALHYGYWDGDVRSHRAALLRLNAVLAQRAEITAGQRVLDAGCGWGGSSIWLARERDARCVGVTLETAQAGVGRMMARRRKVADKTDFALGDFGCLPFADASFDVVWAVESVCHARDKRAFLAEAMRVLAPGGRLVLADFFRRDRNLPADQERLLRQWIGEWKVADLASLAEFERDAVAVGLADVAIEDATDRIRPSAKRLHRTGLWTAPLAGLFRLVGLHSDHQQANWRSSMSQYHALQADAWRYGVVSARKPAAAG